MPREAHGDGSEPSSVATLGRLAARGSVVTIIGQSVRFIIQFGGMVALARLLSPQDFGLIAMAVAIFGIGDVLREFGLLSAAIQADTLTDDQASNLFWLNTASGFLLAMAFAGCAPLISMFYGREELLKVSAVLAIQFVFSGLQTQFQAHLTRELRFFSLSLTEVIAMTVGLALAIGAALLGLRYWAFVVQITCQQGVLLISRWIVSDWSPGAPRRHVGTRPLIYFGCKLALTQMLVYSTRSIDGILVGKRFGAYSLGQYTRAAQLLMIPLNQILSPLTSVALPVLSRVRDDRERMAAYCRRAQICISLATALILSIGIASADQVVPLMFGSNWSHAATLFAILTIGGFAQGTSFVCYWLFLSFGQVGAHFRYSLASRTMAASLLVIGSFWGVAGVAAGYSMGLVLAWPLTWWWVQRATGYRVSPLVAIGARACALGLFSAALSWYICTVVVGPDIAVTSALIHIAAQLACFFGLGMSTPALRNDFREALATVQNLRN